MTNVVETAPSRHREEPSQEASRRTQELRHGLSDQGYPNDSGVILESVEFDWSKFWMRIDLNKIGGADDDWAEIDDFPEREVLDLDQ